jgi:FtsP/CotA-like multicopper oxidase with cupredoxin domain
VAEGRNPAEPERRSGVTSSLAGAWLGVVLVQAVAWAGAAVLSAGAGPFSTRLRSMAIAALSVLGLVAALGATALATALAQVDWLFAAEKLVIAAPIGVLSSLGACTFVLVDSARARRTTAPPGPARTGVLVSAALGAAVAPIGMLLVGPLVTWPAVLAAVLAWLSGSAVALLAALRRPLRAILPASVFAALSVGLLALFTVFGPTVGAVAAGHHGLVEAGSGTGSTSVADLREDATGSVHRFELEAQHDSIVLAGGSNYAALDFGELPGPALVASQGEIVEVTLTNRDVAEGVTLHWHGYTVPNGDDGVAGVTQDAVAPGESYTYRFVAAEPGTYWYHTHQGALEGIRRGLYGAFVVLPPDGIAEDRDVTALIHSVGGSTLVGSAEVLEVAENGGRTRLRLVNTDQSTRRVVLDGDAQLVALDGRDLGDAVAVPGGTVVSIPAGGRADLSIEPGAATALAISGAQGSGIAFGGSGVVPDLSFDGPALDLLDAASGSLPAWADGPVDVRANQVLDKLIRVVGGVPRVADTINSAAFPDIEPIVVDEGDVVEVTIVNRGSEVHPMHLHGHPMLVLSRDGVAADGALWLDSLDVRPGEVWRIAFLADNPGIWMDHCHNLEHAAAGMVMHVAYRGIDSPFELGGDHGNAPE